MTFRKLWEIHSVTILPILIVPHLTLDDLSNKDFFCLVQLPKTKSTLSNSSAAALFKVAGKKKTQKIQQ